MSFVRDSKYPLSSSSSGGEGWDYRDVFWGERMKCFVVGGRRNLYNFHKIITACNS